MNPQLPDGIARLRFRLRWREFRLTVDANHSDVTYTLRDGPGSDLTIRHCRRRPHAEHGFADDHCGAAA